MDESERRRAEQNIGRLHGVKCDWCGLKMACSCGYDGTEDSHGDKGFHPMVMCPRCQVTEFLNLLFGGGAGGREPASKEGS